MKALLKTRPFQCTVATVLVFVTCFILLITIQPPFTYNSNKDTDDGKHSTRTFSMTKASFYALGATGIGFVVAVGLYIFSYKSSSLKMQSSKADYVSSTFAASTKAA